METVLSGLSWGPLSSWAPLASLPRVLLSPGTLQQQAPKGRSPWRYLTIKNVTKMGRRYRHGDGVVGRVLGAPPDGPPLALLPRVLLSPGTHHQQAPKGRSPWRYLTIKNETKKARRYRHGDGAVGPVLGGPFQLGLPSVHSRECFSHPKPSSNRPQKVDLHGGTLHLKT